MPRSGYFLLCLIFVLICIPLWDWHPAPAAEPKPAAEVFVGESGSFVTFVGPTRLTFAYASAEHVQKAADAWMKAHPDVRVLDFSACVAGDRTPQYIITLRIEKK